MCGVIVEGKNFRNETLRKTLMQMKNLYTTPKSLVLVQRNANIRRYASTSADKRVINGRGCYQYKPLLYSRDANLKKKGIIEENLYFPNFRHRPLF